MSRRLRAVLCAAGCGAGAAVAAPIVGPAADYNLFVHGNASLTSLSFSDSAGSIAVGGNAQLTSYFVASQTAGTTSVNPNPARLVVGGDLNASNGGVGSNAGGPPQNGAIYHGGTVTLNSFTANGGIFNQSLVDFAAAQAVYQSQAQHWSGLAANGTATLQFGTLTLSGTLPGLNVFALSGADLQSSNSVNISAPAGATVLINVSGASSAFQNGQIFLQSGITTSGVLYNFYQALTLNLPGSKNPRGSVLAPFAAVSGGFGQLDGQLIAQSFSGNTEFHLMSFDGDLPAAPLPAAVYLLLAGLGLLGFAGRRRRGIAGAAA